LTPLTSNQKSASQTGKQVARGVRGGSTALGGGSTGLVNLGQTAGQSASQFDSQTGSSLSDLPVAVQPVLGRKICPMASFELHLYILSPTSVPIQVSTN
jgi:hypothetical protein